MNSRLTRANIVEVPLPADYQTDQCLPLVIMQPTADATNYMLKTTYATNGQPGVVDHAVVADTANAVQWRNILNTPSQFPPTQHALTHLQSGTDPIPLASVGANASDGLCPKGSGLATDYLGGDIVFHNLPVIFRFRAEGPITLEAGFTSGAVLYSGTIANPVPAIYAIDQPYLYGVNTAYPPSGTVHMDIWDPDVPGWVQATLSTDISVMTAADYLLRPIILSSAMIRVWEAGANALQFRLVLDQATGAVSYFQFGCSFQTLGLQTLPS